LIFLVSDAPKIKKSWDPGTVRQILMEDGQKRTLAIQAIDESLSLLESRDKKDFFNGWVKPVVKPLVTSLYPDVSEAAQKLISNHEPSIKNALKNARQVLCSLDFVPLPFKPTKPHSDKSLPQKTSGKDHNI
jgi:hypothetical protein